MQSSTGQTSQQDRHWKTAVDSQDISGREWTTLFQPENSASPSGEARQTAIKAAEAEGYTLTSEQPVPLTVRLKFTSAGAMDAAIKRFNNSETAIRGAQTMSGHTHTRSGVLDGSPCWKLSYYTGPKTDSDVSVRLENTLWNRDDVHYFGGLRRVNATQRPTEYTLPSATRLGGRKSVLVVDFEYLAERYAWTGLSAEPPFCVEPSMPDKIGRAPDVVGEGPTEYRETDILSWPFGN